MKIKKCKYCGSEAKVEHYYRSEGEESYEIVRVKCINEKCGCQTSERICDGYHEKYCTDEEIISIWNDSIEKPAYIIIYYLTDNTMERIYDYLRVEGYTVHAYGAKEHKKIGVAMLNQDEYIVEPGDFIALSTDHSIPLIPFKGNDLNGVVKLLSQFGELIIREWRDYDR